MTSFEATRTQEQTDRIMFLTAELMDLETQVRKKKAEVVEAEHAHLPDLRGLSREDLWLLEAKIKRHETELNWAPVVVTA